MSLTLDQAGKVLTETVEGLTMPADYTFDNVNDFVHSVETTYEDLECLCLGMATHIERLTSLLKTSSQVIKEEGVEDQFFIKRGELVKGA